MKLPVFPRYFICRSASQARFADAIRSYLWIVFLFVFFSGFHQAAGAECLTRGGFDARARKCAGAAAAGESGAFAGAVGRAGGHHVAGTTSRVGCTHPGGA